MTTRNRAEQKYVLLFTDGTVMGTPSGGPFTRDAAWLAERYFNELVPNQCKALKLVPRPVEETNNG
jgi:hypothetical protein